jgi:hypothetical protein
MRVNAASALDMAAAMLCPMLSRRDRDGACADSSAQNSAWCSRAASTLCAHGTAGVVVVVVGGGG